jgi:hypothetical protein
MKHALPYPTLCSCGSRGAQDAANYLSDALSLDPDDLVLEQALERCAQALRRGGADSQA